MPRTASVQLAFTCYLTLAACGPAPINYQDFDVVINGGRVMDPESSFDGSRNIGIRDGKIVAITEFPLTAGDVLDATGLVVAPGFIDLHAHGQDPESRRYQARDGVTTALELEIGVYPVERWYAMGQQKALINYGASVGYQGVRQQVMGSSTANRNNDGTFSLGDTGDEALYRAATEEELVQVVTRLQQGLAEGGLGLGVGLSYTPGVSHAELLRLFGVAADHGVPVFIHIRSSTEFLRGNALAPLQEVIANAAVTGASLHIVHLNSSTGGEAEAALQLVRGAKARGIDVTTEAYPYTASASLIESALFDRWVNRPAEAYGTLQWVETGERLTPEAFEVYRRRGGWVIMHGRSEVMNEWVIKQPDVIVASDGIPFAEGRAHPRGAGTFARVLGHYVRERQALSLMEGLRKMTLLPARRLEYVAPQMAAKGRVRVGMDADLTLFDPSVIIDRATYDKPDQFSEGIVHVLVGGVFVVRQSSLVEDVMPGQAIRVQTASVD